jgi:hypothetical protein
MVTKAFEDSMKALGLTEADLLDEIDLIPSKIDPQKVAVAVCKKDGVQVCQYCGLPFRENDPRYASIEMLLRKPDGTDEGTYLKVHGWCRDNAEIDQAAQDLILKAVRQP